MSNAVRLNVTVPEDVAETLKEMAGPGKQSSFIANSVRYYAKLLKRKQLIEELKEGYTATSCEGLEIARDFDQTNMDGIEDDN